MGSRRVVGPPRAANPQCLGKALEERMRFLFGDEEAKFMMGNVRVAKE
jgi:hypothetical protein